MPVVDDDPPIVDLRGDFLRADGFHLESAVATRPAELV